MAKCMSLDDAVEKIIKLEHTDQNLDKTVF